MERYRFALQGKPVVGEVIQRGPKKLPYFQRYAGAKHRKGLAKLLVTIRTAEASLGYPPSVRELCASTSTSLSTINERLKRLVDLGLITRDVTHRTIVMTDKGKLACKAFSEQVE